MTPQPFGNFIQFTYNSQQPLGSEGHASGSFPDEQFYVPQPYVSLPSPTTYPFFDFTPHRFDPNLVTPDAPPPFHANGDRSTYMFFPMPMFSIGGLSQIYQERAQDLGVD